MNKAYLKNIFSKKPKNKGITLFIAVVVSGILLFISFFMIDLTIKSTALSGISRESQIAFYAADAGLECAIYWDTRFESSRFDPAMSGAPINCAGFVMSTGDTISGTTTNTLIGGGVGSIPETISFVNSATGSDNTGAHSATISTNSFNVESGNLIVVTVRYFRSSNQDIVSVTDSALNTYTFATGIGGPGSADRLEIWFARNANARSSNVVTATLSSTASFRNITATQYSGVDRVSPLDATATGFVSSGSVINSSNFTTSSDNQLIVASAQIANVTSSWTSGSGYIRRVQTSPNAVLMTQDRIVSSIQNNISAGASNPNSGSKSIAVATFRAGMLGAGGGTNRTSVFGFTMGGGTSPDNPCAIVTVTKDPLGTTFIRSRGYNTCNTSNPRRVERGVEMRY